MITSGCTLKPMPNTNSTNHEAELENKNRPVVESVPTDDMSREAVKQLSQEVRSRDLELEALRYSTTLACVLA